MNYRSNQGKIKMAKKKTKSNVALLGGPSFEVSKKDRSLISKIVKRAIKLADAKSLFRLGETYTLLDCEMDLTACHANGNPLRLEELLKTDDVNFGHDVFGIRRHLDRNTGKLGGMFLPRFSDNKAGA